MSNVERLLTRPERELAAEAQDVLDRYSRLVDAMPATVTFPARRELQKLAAPLHKKAQKRKPYVMTDDEYLMHIMRAIRDLPGKDRPHTVALAFMACQGSLDWNSNRVLLLQQELAKEVGVGISEISKAMGVLERIGVIKKTRESYPGMRGRGHVIYHINPHIAYKGLGQDEARKKHPKPRFDVVEGGAAA